MSSHEITRLETEIKERQEQLEKHLEATRKQLQKAREERKEADSQISTLQDIITAKLGFDKDAMIKALTIATTGQTPRDEETQEATFNALIALAKWAHDDGDLYSSTIFLAAAQQVHAASMTQNDLDDVAIAVLFDTVHAAQGNQKLRVVQNLQWKMLCKFMHQERKRASERER
ncbi:hypothetical protein CAC42_3653 [Sphaceloma murrayae]|uniref:Uncharacterized protein n=1 Tax=Sphaceloma murrayae TaxID=2082308 RepID=A0A2K1QQD0_9PEZI|nr:hypothetical protein CAC42_3653 [Sphaceloma murrayae]